ncbi:MAG TPA: HigA family addiction module antitoxin [Rhizobiaceae bacterium]|nr:HigA family addiction module antitoxin [Rhizobiaceae bacterium]
MANPPHPGFSIADELDALGLSTAEGAAALGVTRQQLHRLVSGKSAISPEMALRLETVIGSSAETWARMQAAYDIAQVRRRAADVTAGLKRIA